MRNDQSYVSCRELTVKGIVDSLYHTILDDVVAPMREGLESALSEADYELHEKDAEISELNETVGDLRARIKELEAEVAELEAVAQRSRSLTY